jgi:hypothetical protein
MAALFAALLADVYRKQGQMEAAQQAVSIGQQQLEPLAQQSLPLDYCTAAVQLAAAQLGAASCNSSGSAASKAAWAACKQALSACGELATAAAQEDAPHAAASWCSALHAAALLSSAEAALRRRDDAAALEHASAALQAVTGGALPACSAARLQQAAALLFLGQQRAERKAPPEPQVEVWGLRAAPPAAADGGGEPAAAAKGRGRRAPAGRGRAKAAATAAAPGDSSTGALGGTAEGQQQLWRALELSRWLVCVHRVAAGLLAEACGRAGHLHLAAWLLHASLGAAMRLQYELVLHSRRRQLLQRQLRGGGGAELAEQAAELERLEAGVLQPGLNWQLVAQLAGGAAPAPAQHPRASGRGRKAAAAGAGAPSEPAAVLDALDSQAQQQLQAWLAALPAGTTACSVSVLPGSGGGSLLISRLAPTAGSAAADDAPPPLLLSLPVQQLSASLSQHPIRALRMDDDDEQPPAAAAAVSRWGCF